MPGYKKLPQVCSRCRKLKMPNLGEFIPGSEWARSHWICHECLKRKKGGRR